jgi:hypothetical protein
VILRSFVVPLFVLMAVLFDTCTVPIPWAVQPTMPPPPSISAEDAALDTALLEDALVEEADFTEISDLRTVPSTNQGWRLASDGYLYGFQDAGGVWLAKRSWQNTAAESYFIFTDTRLLFGGDDQAAAFIAARPNPVPSNFVQLPEILEFDPNSHVFSATATPNAEHMSIAVRNVLIRSLVGRVVIQQSLILRDDRADWEQIARALLERARQHTEEALARAPVN